MALDNAKNFAKVTVSTGYNAAATSIALTSGHGAKLPTAPFNVVWWNASDYGDPSDDPNVEIVRVTAISTDTLTVTRAQEGTSASTKNTAGKTYRMIAGLTAKTFNTDLPGLSGMILKSYSTANASSISVTGLDLEADLDYYIILEASGATADAIRVRFNNDSGTNYNTRFLRDASTGTSATASSGLAGIDQTKKMHMIEGHIMKRASQNTFWQMAAIGNDALTGTDLPSNCKTAGNYNSTTNVTRIDFLSESGNTFNWKLWILKPATS